MKRFKDKYNVDLTEEITIYLFDKREKFDFDDRTRDLLMKGPSDTLADILTDIPLPLNIGQKADYHFLVGAGYPPQKAIEIIFFSNFNANLPQSAINFLINNKEKYKLRKYTIDLLEKGTSQDLIRDLLGLDIQLMSAQELISNASKYELNERQLLILQSGTKEEIYQVKYDLLYNLPSELEINKYLIPKNVPESVYIEFTRT